MVEENFFYLTHAQKRIFQMEQFYNGTSIANIGGTLFIKENIDFDIWEIAINKFIEMNDSFRTRIREVNGEPFQYFSDYIYKKFELVDFTGKTKVEMDSWIQAKMTRSFDVFENDLYEFVMMKSCEGECGVLLRLHHLAGDAWTMGMLGSQLIQNCKNIMSGQINEYGKNPSYTDYIKSERKYLDSERFEKDREFWLRVFKDFTEPSFIKQKDSKAYSSKAKRSTCSLSEGEANKLREFCADRKISPAVLFEAVVAIYLSRILGNDDITIGMAVLNRSGKKEKLMSGMFISTVPLRVDINHKIGFVDFCEQFSRLHMNVFKHQKYPFDLLLKEIRQIHGIKQGLFDVSISYQNARIVTDSEYNYKTEWYFNEHIETSLNVHITDMDDAGIINFHYDYLINLFGETEIADIHKRLIHILFSCIDNPEVKLCDIEIVTEEEKQKILYEFNNTKTDYPRNKTIHQLFEEQVKRTPNDIAVVFEDKKLTYSELNCKANCVARILRDKGVSSDVIVGIMVERSLEMIIGILAILKAGGAYLPIDPEYPEDRISFMLEDSSTKILVTTKKINDKLKFSGNVVNILEQEFDRVDSSNLLIEILGNNLSYVIYTSGSTGKPKGTLIEHHSLTNFTEGTKRLIDFSQSKTILAWTTICFDISILELLLSLAVGLKVIIASEEQRKDNKLISEIAYINDLEMIQATPSRLQLLVNDKNNLTWFKNLTEIIVGGEPFPVLLLKKLKRITKAKIYNMYGPTETTIFSTGMDLSSGETVEIGKPMINTKIYILDKYRNLLPIGLMGELYISGDGLARGYLNRQELTDEKFIDNPFEQDERMYCTGDLARWLPDGNIEYLGRIDHQVKIRGFRIELGEIESCLRTYPSVKECVVVPIEDKNNKKYLCAYIVPEEQCSFSNIKKFLSRKIPNYMIPSYFVNIEKMPLTPNGKINRKLLPKPEGNMRTNTKYAAPSNYTEKKLAKIWQDVLKQRHVGVNDSFFDIGGDSLDAMNLVLQIQMKFGIQIKIKDIFIYQTIREIAKKIEKLNPVLFKRIKKVKKKSYYNMSSAQTRLYLLYKMDEQSTNYNMPCAMTIDGNLDIGRLEAALKKIINRHEVLRTSFDLINEQPVQIVHDEGGFHIGIYDDIKNINKFFNEFIKPFDLKKPPLLRLNIIRINEDKYILLFDMHHIISDGSSIDILIRELSSFYSKKEMPEISVQYKDFVEWQEELFSKEDLKKQEEYWKKRFAGEIPVLNLPLDYKRPAVQSFEGDRLFFSIDKETTVSLNTLCSSKQVTLNTLLFAVYNVLLYRCTGQDDIIVATPVSGRRHTDIQNLIGMFVNTLPIRNFPDGNKGFVQFLNEVKENLSDAIDNQDYQFEKLISKLDINRDPGRNPLFDTMFVLQNTDVNEFTVGDLKFSHCELNNKKSKFDISLFAVERRDEIHFELEYCSKLFTRETIETIRNCFVNIISEVISNPEKLLSEFELLTPKEKHKILYEFNDTKADYPRNKTIHQLFEEQVEKTPDNIAAVFEGKQLTYRELNEKANKFARILLNKGVEPGQIVGIMLERSVDWLISILAILKVGGVLLPLDVNYPTERIDYILLDAQMKILVTKKEYIKKIQNRGFDLEFVEFETINRIWEEKSNIANKTNSNDLIYVIYTSGTTGNPKGVMMKHKNIVNLICFEYQNPEIDFGENILQFANMNFDVCYQEIFSALLMGSKLHIIPDDAKRDLSKFLFYLCENRINSVFLPTAFFNTISSNEEFFSKVPTSVKNFIIAGEQLKINSNIIEYLNNNKDVKIHNHYGPSETHVVTTYILTDNKIPLIPPIGKPISNITIYIMDKSMKLIPAGFVGEIYVSGECLGRGYLNQSDLSNDKFIINPYNTNERLYKTGDLARWLPDGNIEFLGRIDHQVKIRGFRIELGEIESNIMKYKSVKEAIVIDKEDEKGSKYLCSYFTSYSDVDISELRIFLAEKLPKYMIPQYFVQLERLPLTPNGKIDRKALPEPDRNQSTLGEYVAPRDEIEEKLVAIWKEVLETNRVGIYDDFISDLGGDSLKLITLSIKISKEFYVDVPVVDIYANCTIDKLAGYIKSLNKKCDSNANENLILLKSSSKNNENLFLIHDGLNRIESYVDFCNFIDIDINCWGLKSTRFKDIQIIDLNIEDIAREYINIIKEFQSTGPYSIVGWSLGGTIAFEVVRQLEIVNEKIRFVAIFDSVPPKSNVHEEFIVEPLQNIYQKLNKVYDDKFADKYPEMEELIEYINKDYNKFKMLIPNDVLKLFENYRKKSIKEAFPTVNPLVSFLLASKRYTPNSKINSKIKYYKASETHEFDLYEWNKYCCLPVNCYYVEGDHFSMLKIPFVKAFAKRFSDDFRNRDI